MLLCYIFLLHQTTTWNKQNDYNLRCVISFFYIKPQLSSQVDSAIKRCVISFFYIKPQLTLTIIYALRVVLYLSSTSNHNNRCERSHAKTLCYIFLLHQTTTTFNNKVALSELCYIFLLHQTTTTLLDKRCFTGCVISFFYIKPQLHASPTRNSSSCVISFFYIKPQLMPSVKCHD